MVTEQQIIRAHTERWKGSEPRHTKDSARILGALSKTLSDNKIEHTLDTNWPFHLIAVIEGRIYSLYNGGLQEERIDIQRLNINGEAVGKEESRMTNKGVVDYLKKRVKDGN